MKRLLIISLLLCCAVVVRANNPYNIPYIYYYDSYLNGTIVERADGTDSRFLPYHHIEWSPSGRWFVGTIGGGANWDPGLERRGQKKYRVRSDGTQPIEIFEQKSVYDYRNKFSPYHDILAIFDTSEVWTGNNRRWDALMRLVDFSTGEMVASVDISDIDTDQLYPYADRIYWQPDGLSAFFDIGKMVVRLGVDGSVIFQSKLNYYGEATKAFDKGFTLTWSLTSFQLTDQVSGQTFIFNDEAHPLPEGYSYRYQMIWNEWRTSGLITGLACDYKNRQNECHSPQTWVMDWPHKQIYSLSQSISISRDESGRPSLSFSPNGRYAFYTNETSVIDLETKQITPHLADNITGWMWSSENVLALSSGYMNSAKTILFEPSTQLISATLFASHQVYPSPDGHYWGVLTQPPVIKDRSGQVIREWLPHSHSTNSYRVPEQYQWHPNGEWVIGEYMIFFAGGGMGPLAGTVFDLSGSVSRELPTDGNAHFLPETVIPYLLPGQPTSFKPDATFEAAMEGIYMGGENTSIGWNTVNPSLFAIYAGGGLTSWTLTPTLKMTHRTSSDFSALGKSIATNYNFKLLGETAQGRCLTASSGAYEASVLLTRTETGEEITRLWTTGALVAFSDDEHWLITVSEPKIQIWNVSSYCS